MISRRLLSLLVAAGMLSAGCSTFDAINPFASSGVKMSPLPDFKASAEVRQAWASNVGKARDYAFSPAAVGGAIYVANADGGVAKLVDGQAAWKINAGQALSAGVGSDGRIVAVGTPKGEVLAFSAEDGKQLWRATVSSEVLASPAVGDDGIVVRSGDNHVYLLDRTSGERKWAYQRSTPPLSVRSIGSPVFADRFVFVGFPGGKLVALSLQNGAPVWEGTVALPKGATELDRVADVVATPVVDGSQVCAAAFQGRVACFDMSQGGSMVWSRDISSAAGLTLDGRYLFVADDAGVVYALDRISGSSLWKQDKLKHRRLSAPVAARGMLAVADGEGYVHFLSREDGSFSARQKTDGTPVRVPLKVLNGAVLVQTSGGDVAAIDIQ